MISPSQFWTSIWYADQLAYNDELPDEKCMTFGRKILDTLRAPLPAPPSPESTIGKHRVAVVIGHNEKSQGAWSPHLQSFEFPFNKEVAEHMKNIADTDPDCHMKLFYRKNLYSYSAQIRDVYSRVNAWSPELVLELHFDYQNGAGRILMLVYKGSTKGRLLGTAVLDATGKALSQFSKKALIERGASERGGLSLASAQAPCILTEPFDGTSSFQCATVKKIGTMGIARAYMEGIRKYLS